MASYSSLNLAESAPLHKQQQVVIFEHEEMIPTGFRKNNRWRFLATFTLLFISFAVGFLSSSNNLFPELFPVKYKIAADNEVNGIVQKILVEAVNAKTPYCYRDAYDRGTGIAQKGCPSDASDNEGGLCYENCPSGMHYSGGQCLGSCPPRYNDVGLFCTGWIDNCGKGCLPHAETITKPSRGLKPGKAMELQCGSDREPHAGLCYLKPKPAYHCTVTACNSDCGGSQPKNCGVGCAIDDATCQEVTTNMVISGVSVVISVASVAAGGLGAAASTAARISSKAALAANDAAKAAKFSARAAKYKKISESMKKAKELIKKKSTPLTKAFDDKAKADLASSLQTDLNDAAGSNEDFTEIASLNVDSRVASEFGRDTDSYKKILKASAKAILLKEVEDMNLEFLKGVVTLNDPSGILGAINDFTKPKCTDIQPKTDAFCPSCKYAL